MPTRERKEEYFGRMKQLLEGYDTILVVGIDHVSSGQLAKIRKELRVHEATVLMGKNTLMRKVVTAFIEEHPDHPIGELNPYLVGNCGLIFVKKNLDQVRTIVKSNVKGAPAKVGQVAERDVVVPPGPTGCDPGQTQWFQALNVPTKIVKGQIEIVSELKLITKGDKVGASEAGLLQKLNILPFTYGVQFLQVFMNGSVFDCAVLDISETVIRTKFIKGTRFLAAVSLGLGIPTQASLPHSLGRTVRMMLAISAVTNYQFKYSAPWEKLFNLSPEELAKLAAASSAAPAAGGAPAAAAKPKAEEKKEEAVEVDVGGGNLFGGGGGGGKY
jgi:large subunit ribosomal protein LP0